MHALCIAQGSSAQVDPVRLERILRHLAKKYKHISLLLPHESRSPLGKADISKLRISATIHVYHAASVQWYHWWAHMLSVQLLGTIQPDLVCFVQAGPVRLVKYIRHLQSIGSPVKTLFVRLAQTKPLPWYKQFFQLLREDWFLRASTQVVSDSRQYCQQVSRRIPAQKVQYTPIVPADMQSITDVPAPPVAWDVSLVTPLLPGNGIDPVLEAAATIPHCRVLIIGDGPERHRLEQKIVKLQLEGKVQLTGWFPNPEQVIASLKSTRMYIMNSVHLQSQHTLIQAMMSGIPVMSTATELTNGIIRPPDNGLITTGTSADLKKQISWYLESEDRRTYMAERALSDSKQFDTQAVEEAWNTVLTALTP